MQTTECAVASRRGTGRRWAVGLACLLAVLDVSALEFHVSPAGSDAAAGTAAAPFATLARARDAVRAAKAGAGLPAGVTVWLRGGEYRLTETVAFGAEDSGAGSAPIVYAGWPGETVRISGGTALPRTGWVQVDSQSEVWSRLDAAARGQVCALDLRAAGISDFGTLRPRGYGMSAAAPLELFCDGRPMTLAQWPNRGEPWARTLAAVSETEFTYAGTRPERWRDASEIWMHGFWRESWADFHLPVAAVDRERKTVRLAQPPRSFGLRGERPYVAYNLVEEIDEPGEYYVDRVGGWLYFWPPVPLAGARVEVSLLEADLLQFTGTRHVTLRELNFETVRGGLIRIEGGEQVRLERCELRNAGRYGAWISGTRHGLDHCHVVDCGEEGVRLAGGDRVALTPGENYVTNSRLHRTGRLAWTYHPAIAISGCGQVAAHNLIDELPHSAILFSGNDHRLEANEIRRVCQVSSDAGAIYIGRDWGYRGNVIRGNFLHHIETRQAGYGAHGVYLDDCVSGVEVTGNVFYRIGDIAIMAGGGRDLVIRDNVIAACGLAHRNDDRGRTRITNTPGDSWNLLARLRAGGIRYQEPPWSIRYPACAEIPNTWEAVQEGRWRNPENCVFRGNVGWGNARWTAEYNPSRTGVFSVYAAMADNAPEHPPLFDDAAGVDRRKRAPFLRAEREGFPAIAWAAIGRNRAGQPPPTAAPPAAWLEGRAVSATRVDLRWTDEGNLPRTQEAGFVLERWNEPEGRWEAAAEWGPDVTFATVEGLAPATRHAFRIRSFNAVGAIRSNVCTVTTEAAPLEAGAAVRHEAEDRFVVMRDVGTLGPIGRSNAAHDSGQSVRLFDPGDGLGIPFTVEESGVYRLGVRVRCGSSAGPRSYWPGGYRFMLDGADVVLRGDPASVSAPDPSYGIAHWGTMVSGPIELAAGGHRLEVWAVGSYGVVDYVEVAPLISPAAPAAAVPAEEPDVTETTPGARGDARVIERMPGLVAFWTFGEEPGHPRRSRGTPHPHPLVEVGGPIARVAGGPFSGFAAELNGRQYLKIPYAETRDLNISGVDAQVSMFAVVRLVDLAKSRTIAGMWSEGKGRDDDSGTRQYGMLLNMPAYGGPRRLVPHVSSEGGVTRRTDGSAFPWCADYAVSANEVPEESWVTLGFTYDGVWLCAYLNGVLDRNELDPVKHRRTDRYFLHEGPGGGSRGINPYYHGRGIFRYEAEKHAASKPMGGSDFIVGARYAVGSLFAEGSATIGRFGGLAVFNRALSETEMKALHQAANLAALK